MGTVFSETLTRLRKDAGFDTAYRFYHDNGGAPAFKVSYRKYLLIEQGENLPVVDRLTKLLMGLRLPLGTPDATALVLAWLKTMAGEDIYADVFESLLSPKAAGLSPMHAALKRTLAEKKYHLTPEQLAVTLSSFETYKCAFTLESDTGIWTAERLAGTLKIKKREAERGLKELAGAGLVKEIKKGIYRSRVAGMMVEYPPTAAMPPGLREKLRDYLRRLEQEAAIEYSSMGLIRADADALKGVFPLLRANVEAANTYAITEKTPKSAGFFVISRVLRLWDF